MNPNRLLLCQPALSGTRCFLSQPVPNPSRPLHECTHHILRDSSRAPRQHTVGSERYWPMAFYLSQVTTRIRISSRDISVGAEGPFFVQRRLRDLLAGPPFVWGGYHMQSTIPDFSSGKEGPKKMLGPV